jgi:hypothetical protein
VNLPHIFYTLFSDVVSNLLSIEHKSCWGVMTEEEIEAVAQELAKVGGPSWYPGRTRGPLLRSVGERYRDRARVAIAALERLKASKEGKTMPHRSPSSSLVDAESSASEPPDHLQVGRVVVYRPPGDRRAMPCQVAKIEADRAYLVPCPRSDVGWVSLEDLSPINAPPQSPNRTRS